MHSVDHEDWCPALAAGDADAVPAALRSEIDACTECALRIEELRALRRDLSRLGDDDRALLAEAGRASATDAERRIEQRLRDLSTAPKAERTTAPRPIARRWLWLAAASLAVAAAGWLAMRPSPSSSDPRLQMLEGEEHFLDMQPTTPVDELESLSWREPLELDEYFTATLRVIADGRVIEVSSPRLRTSEWRPTDAELARLPVGPFEWSVQVLNDQVPVRASRWIASSRSR